MQGRGIIGLWNVRGTGSPWFIKFPGMIPAGWEVHKSPLYSVYIPRFSHSSTDKEPGYKDKAVSSTPSLYFFICPVSCSQIQVNKQDIGGTRSG